jgi:RIO-like serine/threonine protein kinase
MSALQKLKETCAKLQAANAANSAEDIFGDLDPADQVESLKQKQRELVHIVFVDQYTRAQDKKMAEEGLTLLNKWHAIAKKRIADKVYGNRAILTSEITLTTKTATYTLIKRLPPGNFCDIYGGVDKAGKELIFKIPRNPANSALLINEAKQIKFLREESPAKGLRLLAHIPELVDSFDLQQGKSKKRVNVFKQLTGYYSLAQVIEAYPAGVDIKDAAWMFNRFIAALAATFRAGLVHGAVIPANLMICPANHNGVLIDWAYSVKSGEVIRTVSTENKLFYPPEVFDKRPALIKGDIYMLANCLIALLGGNIEKKSIPAEVPRPIKGIIKACLLSVGHRTCDPFELHAEFGETLKAIYGPRKWRDFVMPNPPK